MKQIPSNVTVYKKTPIFSEASVPKGLLKDHTTKDGVWGAIVILDGELEYNIQESKEIIRLDTRHHGVVEPMVKHHISLLGPVKFYVAFYR